MIIEKYKPIRDVIRKHKSIKSFVLKVFPEIDPLLFDLYPEQAPKEFDVHQAAAWASIYKKNVIFAGAGAGKTKVAVERAKLLVERGIAPEKILFITFTLKAASQLKDRLGFMGDEIESSKTPAIMTIHEFSRLCYQAIDNEIKQIYGDEVWEPLFKVWETVTEEYLDRYPEIKAKFHEWLELRWIDPQNIDLDYLFKSPSHYPPPQINTRSGIKVRSQAELKIANFLFDQGIKFAYEQPVLFCDFPFQPDFFLPEVGSYIEYYGLVEAANPSVRNRYIRMCQMKREQFEKHGYKDWVNIYLEPKHLRSGEYRTLIQKKIEQLNKYTKRVKYKYIEKETADKIKIKMAERKTQVVGFLKEVSACLSVNQCDPDILKNRMPYVFHELIDMVKILTGEVNSRLLSEKKMTANRMMEDLGQRFSKNNPIFDGIRRKYDYIFLDEFQDVTPVLFCFLKRFLVEIPFFAIGDDRQAIYGFAGGTPHFIRNLKKEVKGTQTKSLLYNYRSNKTIVETSKLFTALGSINTQARNEAESTIYVLKVDEELRQIKQVFGFIRSVTEDEVMVLGRYTSKADKVVKAYESFIKSPHEFMTVHKSKGLERKAVLIVNVNEGNDSNGNKLKYTFPAADKDHPVVRYIKQSSLQDDILEEESRLFYVALSRAQEHLFIVTEKNRESRFIKTILKNQPRTQVVELRS